mgnify:CR=1 FL=1
MDPRVVGLKCEKLKPEQRGVPAAADRIGVGDQLRVRRASKVAQALWLKPERALRPAVSAQLSAARQEAQLKEVQVEFLGSG